MWTNTLPKDGCMKDLIKQEIMNKNRQELPVFYRLIGAIYLTYCNYIKSKNFFGKNNYVYIMLNERSIDVDRYLYFKIEEILVKKIEGAK